MVINHRHTLLVGLGHRTCLTRFHLFLGQNQSQGLSCLLCCYLACMAQHLMSSIGIHCFLLVSGHTCHLTFIPLDVSCKDYPLTGFYLDIKMDLQSSFLNPDGILVPTQLTAYLLSLG